MFSILFEHVYKPSMCQVLFHNRNPWYSPTDEERVTGSGIAYYSVLIKGNPKKKTVEEIYRVKLPGKYNDLCTNS